MKLDELRKKILKFNEAYEKGDPIIEDYIYDFYKKKLEIMEKFENNKISNMIGSTLKSNNVLPHLFPILSLHHDFGHSGINSFIKKISKKFYPFPLIAEIKIDGVSVIIRYNNGILENIKTRGDGYQGEDITHLKNFLNIPNNINIKDLLEIRCEAYIEKNIIKNARNAVAGILLKKNIDPNIQYIKFAPHNLYSDSKIYDNYVELRELFKNIGFDPILPFKICNNIEECDAFFIQINQDRETLPNEIDGVVFKINDKSLQDQLGSTAKAPKHSFAIKFCNAFNISTIVSIKLQMSRTGNLTPVAYIEPTIIQDRKITKATLNNLDDLYRKNFSIGDIIQIEIAGDVIPKITKIIEKKNTNEKIEIITNCPFCNSILENNMCQKNWECVEQKIQKLIYFASKPAMNIKDMGETQIRFFVNEGILNYPQDFFNIYKKTNKIKNNPNWLGEKSLMKLINNIEKAKYTNLNQFYISIGLPLIGKEKVKLLSEKFNIMDFLNSDEKSLQFLGENIAKYVYIYKETEKQWILETSKYIVLEKKYKPFNLFSI